VARMRIAIVIFSFPEPSETFVLDQIDGLAEAGHDVTIIARHRSGRRVSHPVLDKLDLRRCLHAPADDQRRPWSRAATATRLCASRPARALATVRDCVQGMRGVSSHLLDVARVTSRLAPFDVVHAHFGPNGLLAVHLRKIGALSGPIVTTYHGIDLTRTLAERGPAFYAPLFRAGELHLPVSRTFRAALLSAGADPDRCFVQHMGVDTARFAFAPPGPAPGAARLVTVARLVEKKGVAYAIRAVAELHRAGRALEYMIIGDGPDRPALERLSQEFGLTDTVRFAGWMDTHAVRAEMKRADALLAPSVTARDQDAEGIPVTIMEAMASGLPVVSTRHSGIPELVIDGETGHLVDERDATGLARAVGSLLDAPDRGATLAAAARALVEREYDKHVLNRRLLRHFEIVSEYARRPEVVE